MATRTQEHNQLELLSSDTAFMTETSSTPSPSAPRAPASVLYNRLASHATSLGLTRGSSREASDGSDSARTDLAPTRGLVSSLPSTRLRVAQDKARMQAYNNPAPWAHRSLECDFRFQSGLGQAAVPHLTESGYELELEKSIEGTERGQVEMPTSTAPLGYLDTTLSVREEERLLNRDKSEEIPTKQKTRRICMLTDGLKKAKNPALALIVIASAIVFACNKTERAEPTFVTLNRLHTEWFNNSKTDKWKFVTLTVYGPFQDVSYHSFNTNFSRDSCAQYVFLCGPSDAIPESCPYEKESSCKSIKIIDTEVYATVTRTLMINKSSAMACPYSVVQFFVRFSSFNNKSLGFQVKTRGELLSDTGQAILAFVILVFVYLLIGFEIIDRTLAAMIGSSCALAALSLLNKRPSLDTVASWIDLETVTLLLGMMILVGIFSKTGFFDYIAVKAYKTAKGRTWPLLLLLCCLSAVLSAFLDNVTTILLVVPVSIRLSEVLNLDPRPVLVAEVMFSNIGGTATGVGDPPNVIIVAHKSIIESGITFSEVTLHLFFGTIFVLITAFVTLSIMYTHCFHYVVLKNNDPSHIAELKREITIWERASKQLSAASPEERAVQEALSAKAAEVTHLLYQEQHKSSVLAAESWQKKLSELEQNYCITDKTLLLKSTVVLVAVVILFFLSNMIPNFEFGLGWIAIFGSVVMLILSGIKDLVEVMHKIEWSTLLFFAGLFVLMEGLNQMGLINFVGLKMVDVIKLVPKNYQLLVAIVVIVWGSAFVSAFIDNVPFVTTLIPVIVELAESPEVCLTLRPLVWALAFGGCLGGNATLIGASANVVCAGVAEQNGYKISFKYFMKIGFPMMITTVTVAMIYLLIAHAGAKWNAPDPIECI